MTATPANHAVKRSLLTDALVLIGLAAALTLAFASPSVDLAAARLFYSSDILNHWPLATRMPWSALYRASTWLTAALVLLGLGGFVMGVLRHRSIWRRYAIFLLLSVVIGPGLIINVVFKDHWDRPRPRDIIAFGGPMHYTMAPLRGEAGASFPCGHCSVGFLYALGWWIWRRRRPHLAIASAAAGAAMGLALGLGRMAAGGHFLSDVLWSALIALGVAHLLYHHVLRIPAEEAIALGLPAIPTSHARQLALATLALLGGATVLLALFATPHGTQIATAISLASLPQPPQTFELDAAAADVDITILDTPFPTLGISGELHGFGLPTSKLSARRVFTAKPLPTLAYHVVQRGWFTDLNSHLVVRLPLDDFHHLVVRLHRGNIRVMDATQAAVTRTGRLTLDLHTDSGIVQRQRAPVQ